MSAAVAALASAAMAWLGLFGFAWTDYETEARPAFAALVHGHVAEFLRLAPAYGGSLVERAPFALAPSLWGGGELAVYRMVALPCLLAAAALGVWLVADMRARRQPRGARALALALCVANPVTLRALELGHPEDLLGASMCVAAVLLAAGRSVGRGRALAVGVLLGLAVANKEWALIAVGPALLALPSRRRVLSAASGALTAGAVLAPLALASSGNYVAGTKALASAPSAIFQPWQLFWFFGRHGALVHGAFGSPKPGYREAAAWASSVSHPLILVLAAALSALLWLRFRRLCARDALLALALLGLARCVLDTWDAVYYSLPFLLALLAWEVRAAPRRPPALALVCTILVWASFQWLPGRVSPDAQSALYLAWTLPLAVWLARRLLRPAQPVLRPIERRPGARARARRQHLAQRTTLSALGKLVRTS